MKINKIGFYVATGLLSLMITSSVIGFYFLKNDQAVAAFESFGYPIYLVYPYGVLKLIGIIVLWLPGLKSLKEWTYSAFFFAFVLAFFAHFMVNDGEHLGAIMAIVLLLVSYLFYKRIISKN